MIPTATVPILDMASPQGNLTPSQWCELADRGIQAFYAKCGNGNNQPDPTFRANVAGARSIDRQIGVYSVPFVLPVDNVNPAHAGRSPLDQANAHFRQCGAVGIALGDPPPMVDLEWPEPKDWQAWGVTADFARAFALLYLGETKRLWGRTPVLYLYPDYEKHLFAGATSEELVRFQSYPLWIARYETNDPGTLPPWASPRLWQKSDGGFLLPNGAHADEDVFLGDFDAWQAFCGAA